MKTKARRVAVQRAALLIAQEAAGLPERIHAAAWLAESEAETVAVLSARLADLLDLDRRAVEIFRRAAVGNLGASRETLTRYRVSIIKSIRAGKALGKDLK
jgi:hypothetical protein